jgi:sugar lactone lactonase YvrE
MPRPIVTPRGIMLLLAAAVLGSTACGGGDRRAGSDDPPTADSAAAAAPAGPSARVIATVDSLQAPEAARWDPDQNVWFVANVNGNVSAKDNNGFISRLKPDGSIDSLKFIAGGRNKVTLNAPKGMAIVDDTLWVADLDAVRGFNRKTGALVANIKVPGAVFINDVAAGPDGLYATDTGVIFAADGSAKHPGPDAIYQITGRKVTTAIKFDGQPGPNGITWDPNGERFIIAPFGDKAISSWVPGDSAARKIGEGPGMFDGIEAFGPDRFLVTSWVDSSLNLLTEGKVTKLAGGIAGPADIGYDRESGRVAVPQLTENKLQILQLDAGE